MTRSTSRARGKRATREERKAALERAVVESTREFRGEVRSRSDFEALVAHRHEPVNHPRHLAVLAALVALAILDRLTIEAVPFPAVLGAPLAYAAFWLGLTYTRGEELERLTVDERGHLTSVTTGRSLDLRGDTLKIALPALVILIGGSASAVLIYNLLFPALPDCPYGQFFYPPRIPVNDNELCQLIPSPMGAGGGWLTVGQVKALNRGLQLYGLAISLALTLPAVWFLWRMLTGRFVLGIGPVRGRTAAD